MTALANTSSNCKLQTRPLVREGAPYQQTRNSLKIVKKKKKKNWFGVPDGCLTPRQTGRQYVGRVGKSVGSEVLLRPSLHRVAPDARKGFGRKCLRLYCDIIPDFI
jgi:hypothetical protein